MGKCTQCPKCGANLDHGERCDECYQNETASSKCCALMVVSQPTAADPVSELECAVVGNSSGWNVAHVSALSQNITSTHFSAEQMDGIQAVFAKISEVISEFVARMREVITAIADAILSIFKCLWDSIARVIVPPKWWHFYKYSKKARIRKKYENKIRRRFALLFETAVKEGIR